MSPSGARGPDPMRALAVSGVYLLCVVAMLAAVRPGGTPARRATASRGGTERTASAAGSGHVASSTTMRVAAPATTTTSLPNDPGRLPQTDVKPSTDSAVFVRHARALWKAVVDDEPARARTAFFPQSAYVQIKAIADPAGDWTGRLLADFATDVHALHTRLGADAASAAFVGLVVPSDLARWIEPGVEYNSGAYWRVFGSALRYRLPDGSEHELPVTSLISWRGEWYVVHLGAIR